MNWKSKREEKRRLEKLYEETRTYYACGVYQNDKRDGILARVYPYSTGHPNNKKWWRRHSNRKYRRNKNEFLNRGEHKKIFDLWWTLS